MLLLFFCAASPASLSFRVAPKPLPDGAGPNVPLPLLLGKLLTLAGAFGRLLLEAESALEFALDCNLFSNEGHGHGRSYSP